MRVFHFLLITLLLVSCGQNTLTNQEKDQYLLKGKQISETTMHHLGSNLMKVMKAGGPKSAIYFCNLNASLLTLEVSKKHNVTIKRTSRKVRNESNKPNLEETIILNKYLESILKGEKLAPIIEKDKAGKVHYYRPIITKKKCLMCHGEIKNEVNKSTYDLIKTVYPKDKATGFEEGELIGRCIKSYSRAKISALHLYRRS